MEGSTKRFSSRVENYVRCRPGYPPELLEALRHDCGLGAGSVVADIGSGTGILSEIFLRHGNPVVGVEPNDEMRAAGERLLAGYESFTSVAGTAEATGLPDASADFVTAGQAFHWFDREPARREFARILRPGGWVALVWNNRRAGADCSPFERDYERLLLDFSTDYEAVKHAGVDLAGIRRFIGSGAVKLTVLPNQQVFDCAGIEGRLMSSSYAPEPGHVNHAPMLERLRTIFRAHEQNGTVSFRYDTQLYCSRLPE